MMAASNLSAAIAVDLAVQLDLFEIGCCPVHSRFPFSFLDDVVIAL
jgi:hypothetical protein